VKDKNILRLARLDGKPEIFHSIQGEGKSLGRPSIFVRTSLCNLHCVWCDTDYTWNWVGTKFPHQNDGTPGYQKFDKKEWISDCPLEMVVELIRTLPCLNVILTGGEPLLQQEALAALMVQLRQENPAYRFEVETNGTLVPTAAFEAGINQYNVSPKLENSGNTRKLREKPAAYQFFSANPKATFKFVLASENDLQEVLRLIELYEIPENQIWLMPEAANRPELALRRRWLVELCKSHGFNYSDRLHVEIWGGKRGV
jgi:organic radical activating enzyme